MVSHWTEDPRRVAAVGLIDRAHACETTAKRAPISVVDNLRNEAAACRRAAREILEDQDV